MSEITFFQTYGDCFEIKIKILEDDMEDISL